MSREIRGKFGVIGGTYKKEVSAPVVSKPCEHVTMRKERALRQDIVVIIHGKANGESSVTEHLIGSGARK